MNNSHRRQSEASQRFSERRKREDEAPRLLAEIPQLESLKLEIGETSGGAPVAEPAYVRRIVVQNAPALFFVACGDSRCKDGGHDITHEVLRQLRTRGTSFRGEDSCAGSVGSSPCGRTLRWTATATYGSTTVGP
jgi:hypothetical protein